MVNYTNDTVSNIHVYLPVLERDSVDWRAEVEVLNGRWAGYGLWSAEPYSEV